MPGKDGTGPLGQGPIAGRVTGTGRRGQRGGMGVGPGGYCICPRCGEKIVHTVGIPCSEIKCPGCGSLMVRG